MPEVSIIIPTYNRADYLEETIESVISQTFDNWECLIVDDGSTDNSKYIIDAVIAKDSRFHSYSRVDTNRPKGVSSCRNIGIEKATSSYIIFLDSDDLLLNHCLAYRLQYIKNAQVADFYIFKMQVLKNNKRDRIIGKEPKDNSPESYLEMIFEGIQPFTVTSLLWSRETLLNLGGFDQNLLRLEDPDLHLRAFYNAHKFVHFHESEPDCLYRMDDTYQNKFGNKELLAKICNSFLFFTKKHISLLNHNRIIDKRRSKDFVRQWSLHFLKTYFLKLNSASMYFRFWKLIVIHGLFSMKQLFSYVIIVVCNLLGLHKIKGLGYYRFQARFFD